MTDHRLMQASGPRAEVRNLGNVLDAIERIRDVFWSRVDRSLDGCWEYPGRSSKEGYVRRTVTIPGRGQRSINAHRIAYFLTHGHWPSSNLCVCHSCDNPRCVNPDHLWVGTPRDNSRDMVAKGRQVSGAAKLSDSDVVQLRALIDAGIPHLQIQKLTGVNRRTIGRIARGDSYGWVAA